MSPLALTGRAVGILAALALLATAAVAGALVDALRRIDAATWDVAEGIGGES